VAQGTDTHSTARRKILIEICKFASSESCWKTAVFWVVALSVLVKFTDVSEVLAASNID
jgi:hypothetical protein